MEYTIGEISQLTNLPISTLRYYEKEGILINVERKSGIRYYNKENIDAIRLVECLKKSGLQLNEIVHFMELCKQGDSTIHERYELFVKAEERIRNQIRELEKSLDLIQFKKWYYGTAMQDGKIDREKLTDIGNMPEEIKNAYLSSHPDAKKD